jgi:hypothetical protein
MQHIEHTTLHVYGKTQKSLPQNPRYWWVQMQNGAWDVMLDGK